MTSLLVTDGATQVSPSPATAQIFKEKKKSKEENWGGCFLASTARRVMGLWIRNLVPVKG